MGPSTARGWAWGGTHLPSAMLDPGLGPHQPWVLDVPILEGSHGIPHPRVRTYMMSPTGIPGARAHVTSSPRDPVQHHPRVPRSLQQVLQQGRMGTDQVGLHHRQDGPVLATQNLILTPKPTSWSSKTNSWSSETISWPPETI